MAVFLKAKVLRVATTGSPTNMTLTSVNHWVKRYRSEGFSGLYTKPGQGRKPLINNMDEESVFAAIKADRQNVQAAKAAWEASSGKSVSRYMPAFFKKLGG